MPSWWGKSSTEVNKKSNRGIFIDILQRKCIRTGAPRRHRRDTASEKGSQSRENSQSPARSTPVSRCQSFVEKPQAQPLPLPKCDLNSDSDAKSTKNKVGIDRGTKSSTPSPSKSKQKDQSRYANKKISRDSLNPANVPPTYHGAPTSPQQRRFMSHSHHLQIPLNGAFSSAPDSSMSSPSRSAMMISGHDPVTPTGFSPGKLCADTSFLGPGQCPSPGSSHNSGNNSVGGDIQFAWPQSRCSPEYSPLPSPRMASPGPSSRINSGAVSPLHPRDRGPCGESPVDRTDAGKQQSHWLPLPPLTTSRPPFSPSYVDGTSPGIPCNRNRTENPPSPGSSWKKGRLLGRGSFGHVYQGFNSDTGEMCAMKEVALFMEDSKSRESAKQLVQEIALLSQLHHPNIVQYYGSETIDDKLYIYLEYVSGGSIHKVLQEYGQLGEAAIRSYTQQILAGLAYLHSKNTVHRDIKGANILVDPSGRIKLADFGMAKHIAAQSCPLSLKGSPYWMAPEIIKNSSVRNLAVDIWSLGCTVLEMATTKPPWSQYEGVAAMFKIGHGKELPLIPSHLSDEGKDFVMQCLQRNPLRRPAAAQLLEHPFVKNTPLERPILVASVEAIPSATDPVSLLASRHSRAPHSSGVINHQSRSQNTFSGLSNVHVTRNISCPVSPTRSPLLPSRSPQHMPRRLSPPHAFSPCITPVSSTPVTGGNGTLPLYYLNQPKSYLQKHTEITARSQAFSNYQDQRCDIFRVVPQANISSETVSSQDGFLRDKVQRPLLDDLPLASQQLLKNPLRFDPSLDLNLSVPLPSRNIGAQ